MITKNKEDYLKAIYHLKEEIQSDIKSTDIVKYLNISKPSVSEMIRHLVKQGFISYESKKIKLTKKGLKEAINLTRKHRIIEIFLKEVLKIGNNKIHDEAHKLEHAFSDESISSIYKLIKNKDSCPHGKKIPKLKEK